MRGKIAVVVGIVGLVAIGAVAAVIGLRAPAPDVQTIEVFSDLYAIDRNYRSMMGPTSVRKLSFPPHNPPELVWITGYRAEVVHDDGSPAPQEYMCHSNLDFEAASHARLHGLPVYHTGRLFTLSQGQQEIEFPKGFGLPFYTDEEFNLTSQVLNLNPLDSLLNVRHRVELNYVIDRELRESMKPLFMTSAWGLKLLEGDSGHYGVESPVEEEHGMGCLPGQAAGPDQYEDEFNRRFSGHWVVEPGREVNRTLVTNIMRLPYDTTMHYAAVHLHPFAESLELRDLSTGKTVYKSEAEVYDDKIGLRRVEYFSSRKGVELFADHEYELISTYNNTTEESQDSMAVMLMYLLDKKFAKKQREGAQVVHVDERATLTDDRLVLETNFGAIQIGLYAHAERHLEQIKRLVEAGVYDGMRFSRVEPGFVIQLGSPDNRIGKPLTAEQRALLEPLEAELSDLTHRRYTVSMTLNDNRDINSAEVSFFITLTDQPALDQQFTVIGRVTGGHDAIQRIADVRTQGSRPMRPVYIERARLVSASRRMAEAEAARSGG